MQTPDSFLVKLPFFRGLKPEHLKLIAEFAVDKNFQEGQFLFHEGEKADSFYIIRNGRVQLEIFSRENRPITIHTEQSGEIVGWSWMVPPYCWRFDARAAEPTSAVVVDGERLRQMCENNHDLGYELMKRFALIIAERLEATRLQLLDIYGK